MGAVLEAFLAGNDEPHMLDTATLRLLCRNVVADHLGTRHAIELPKNREALSHWRDELRDLHVIDGECRSGSYLVAALEELTDLTMSIEEALGTSPRRSAVKRRILTDNLRGLVKNDLAVQVSRFRLALAALADEREPTPLPDIRPVVRKGGMLGTRHAGVTLPPEGPRTEYKASFEWDPRRRMRNPALRLGCLKTIAAFLNSEGGTLYIGVVDSGVPVGIADDLAMFDDVDPEDTFHNRFREMLKNHLDPIPLNDVTLSYRMINGLTVAAVDVQPFDGVTYLAYRDRSGQRVESVFVRDGNRTLELRGRDRDRFVVKRNS
ncbi:MAG TPA: ATP-binding protein, partial [Fimbriimonadaceae bacterium]|nr:ATP-binding protein [Fimbriimonadaceae bacterium]